MKKITSALLALVITLSLCACDDESNVMGRKNREHKLKLSSSCDRMLASGVDGRGNEYELVANETEDYSGTTIEIGVIKNNEWLIPLSTESPFIGEDGLLYGAGSIYDKEFADFHYVGNGCFYFNKCIWNVNDDSVYCEKSGGSRFVVEVTGDEWVADDEGIILLQESYCVVYALDTNTMDIREINLETDGYEFICFPYSDGLFAVINNDRTDFSGFYNLQGEKIIDLSKYVIHNDLWSNIFVGSELNERMVFENGTCTFTITNDQGSDYRITINKMGEVIDSRKLGE